MHGASTLLVLGCCLVVVALANASETALFSLGRADRARLERDESPAGRAALALLEAPRTLLVLILLVAVSTDALYFGVSAGLAHDLAPSWGIFAIPACAALAVLARLVVGEITPKALAALAPLRVARVAARPLALLRILLVRVTTPIEEWLTTIGAAFDRVAPDAPPPLRDADLASWIAGELEEGRLARPVGELLLDALELADATARAILVPRARVASMDLRRGRADLVQLVREGGHAHVLVHGERGPDEPLGFVRATRLVGEPDADLATLVEPARRVPESATLESLVEELVPARTPPALPLVVIDEHGGVSGIVPREVVLRELLGLRAAPDASAAQANGAGAWRLGPDVPVGVARELLGARLPRDAATVGGLVARALGRLPRAGDEVALAGVRLRVETADERGARELHARREVALREEPRP